MSSENIKNSIVKYLTKQASNSELEELEEWSRDDSNKREFSEYVKVNYLISLNAKKFDTTQSNKSLLEFIHKEKKVKRLRLLYTGVKWAAVILLILGVGYVLTETVSKNTLENNLIIVDREIHPGTDKATLTLEDGTSVVLVKGDSINTNNATSNGAQLVYTSTNNTTSKEVMNYLTVPRGGEFFIQLSDGTQVWLNSESQLKYPVNFVLGEEREVELVYGEAYFSVSPSSENKGSKFIVLNKSQEIEVIGTEFNVKAYKDETNVFTTLVEGSVSINVDNQQLKLLPNQQLNLDLKDSSLTVNTVDIFNVVSWKEGVFSFEKKSLIDIMQVLSRWYDIKVVFTNDAIKHKRFNGVLSKDQDIAEILSIIKNYKIIKDYEVNGNTIVLK
ncbi:hypothetical protein KCTC52924_00413 [Arenibacter antarcticus]|uniref:FecR family protein n=1 Tax=Arenibacter antarcticus TaxID=2040469 RepID=A0ABW5VCA0_9FLAO|nr:FecR domain-containing protein [Arenibacter sp. H213]MCM4169380.1 hypothetical protein [Arenibacter sp. H213]